MSVAVEGRLRRGAPRNLRAGQIELQSRPRHPEWLRSSTKMSQSVRIWARRVSNLRPLACEASALPLSYAPWATESIGRRTCSAASTALGAWTPEATAQAPWPPAEQAVHCSQPLFIFTEQRPMMTQLPSRARNRVDSREQPSRPPEPERRGRRGCGGRDLRLRTSGAPRRGDVGDGARLAAEPLPRGTGGR